MDNRYRMEPKKRVELRDFALQIRKSTGLDERIYFPIVEFMEHMMPRMFDNYNFEIIEDNELPPNKDAVTEIVNGYGTVKIKKHVYEGACNGNGQHRMTIAHEVVGHFIPICVAVFSFYSTTEDEYIPAYCDPEWQAKCIAAEFMMPFPKVGNLTPKELIIQCGVSKKAAEYQRKIYRELIRGGGEL
ncbi:MAG: hypothetical protein K5776_10015 [Lachnospiraceae bacterium]|nr:hypothetical protein [Lachnospiraceae bacterium]